MDSKEIYKVFGLTDNMINNISNSQETTQKQLDILLKNITNDIIRKKEIKCFSSLKNHIE